MSPHRQVYIIEKSFHSSWVEKIMYEENCDYYSREYYVSQRSIYFSNSSYFPENKYWGVFFRGAPSYGDGGIVICIKNITE